VVVCCVYDNKPLGYIKCGRFFIDFSLKTLLREVSSLFGCLINIWLAGCIIIYLYRLGISRVLTYIESVLARLLSYDINWSRPTPLQRGSGNVKLV